MTPPDHRFARLRPPARRWSALGVRPAAGDFSPLRIRRQALLGILHRQHPQPQYAPGVLRRGLAVFQLVRAEKAPRSRTSSRSTSPPTSSSSARCIAKPTVKQHLAAIRMLFDWLVTGQVMPTNPGARGARAASTASRRARRRCSRPRRWAQLLDFDRRPARSSVSAIARSSRSWATPSPASARSSP